MPNNLLKIRAIDAKKTPQSGDYRAGVSVWQDSEPDNRDSWNGGESKYSGTEASFPVALEIGGLNSGDRVNSP